MAYEPIAKKKGLFCSWHFLLEENKLFSSGRKNPGSLPFGSSHGAEKIEF
jgi:hypothetical protein